jgi:LacI family transcriptional regulator
VKSLSDIARELGVSATAVSYVYNGKWRQKRIGADLAGRIQDRLTAEHAAPSAIGNQLRTGKTQTIGIILADLTKPYYLDLLCGIAQTLATGGYLSLLCHSQMGRREGDSLRELLSRGVDGIILAPHRPDVVTAQLQAQQARHIPVVLVDNYLPDTDLDFVVSDNRWGAHQAVRHCIRQGCRRIAHVIAAASPLAAIRDRCAGARTAAMAAGLDGDRYRVLPSAAALESFLAGKPDDLGRTGIVAASFHDFGAGFQALARLKRRIPRDLMVVGFDSVPMETLGELCAYIDEPIPTVKQCGLEMGAQAAKRLMARLHGTARGRCRRFIKPELLFTTEK